MRCEDQIIGAKGANEIQQGDRASLGNSCQAEELKIN